MAQRVFGDGDHLRPSFVRPCRCRNVLVRDVTVVTHDLNNDGCNPESSTDVVIRGRTFGTGDDCIAVKSGRNADSRHVNVPSERLLVEDWARLQPRRHGINAENMTVAEAGRALNLRGYPDKPGRRHPPDERQLPAHAPAVDRGERGGPGADRRERERRTDGGLATTPS